MKKLALIVLLVCAGLQGRERYESVSTGLIAHYKLNDNAASTAVVDSTGTKNGVYTDDITPVNTSTGSVAGKINRALDLDTDEWVDVGNHAGSIKSIVMWVNPDAVNVTDCPINLNDTDYITIVNGTVTKNGYATGTQVIYVDGVVGTTVTANWHLIGLTSTVGFTASALSIGRTTGSSLDGLIDNVMLFSTTLNPSQVSKLYNSGRGTEAPDTLRERY